MVREEINRSLLVDGVQEEEGTELLSHLAHLGLGYLLQQALEQEQEDFPLAEAATSDVEEARRSRAL